jgi:hypothetical protein
MHMLSDGGGGTISGCIISARSEWFMENSIPYIRTY